MPAILELPRVDDLSDPATVRRIASLSGDDVDRNWLITQSYYEIGRRLRHHLGERNADWATSAAWASGAVGLIIRSEEQDESRVMRLARRASRSAYDRVLTKARANLAEGNRQVYSEVGLAFAEFAELLANEQRDRALEQDFLANLPPTSRSVPVDYQVYTRLAPPFELYLEAAALDDGDAEQRKRKSELIFGANLLITACEQAGLQPFLDASFQRISREVADRFGSVGRWPLVRGLVQVAGYSTQALGQRVMTEYGIKVKVGPESVRVGRSVGARGRSPWCADLCHLTDPCVREIYDRFSRGLEDGRRTSAADWTVMDDRMNFIANFFRARQQDPQMRAPRAGFEVGLPRPLG